MQLAESKMMNPSLGEYDQFASIKPHLDMSGDSNTILQTAALLFSEYICLAIMSFPYSYSVLGLVPGLILTVVVAGLVLYTSLVLWYVCTNLENPSILSHMHTQGILSTPPRSQGRLRYWPNALLQLEMGLVLHSRDVCPK
jgi:hypothetical protein